MTTETANTDYTMVNGIPLPSRRTRRNFSIAIVAFCMFVIVGVLRLGDPTNSLHTSALAWSYTLMAGVFSAYCFGAVIDNFNVLKSAK